MSFAFNNFYFDSDDFEQPIKRYIDDRLWFKLMHDRMKDTDVFVRKNYMVLQDDFVQVTGEKEGFFTSVVRQRETFDTIWETEPKVLGMFFRMDKQVDMYERQVYSSGDLLAQVGGIYSFLHAIGAILVFMFSERLLVAALAGKLYQVYDDKPRKDKKKQFHSVDQSGDSSRLNRSSNKIHDISVSKVDEETKFYKANPLRNLYKNTLYCKSKTGTISEKLKKNKALDEVDHLKIKNLVMNRKRFNYNSCHVLEFMIC